MNPLTHVGRAGYHSRYVGSSDPVLLCSCFEEKACGANYCVFLWGVCSFGTYCRADLTGICCNEVVQVLVNETVLVLICTIANYRIQDRVKLQIHQSWVDVRCWVNESGESGPDRHWFRRLGRTGIASVLPVKSHPVYVSVMGLLFGLSAVIAKCSRDRYVS